MPKVTKAQAAEMLRLIEAGASYDEAYRIVMKGKKRVERTHRDKQSKS